MISHRSVRKQLYEFLREELPERSRRDVEAHVAACDECRRELEALRGSVALLDRHVRRPHEERGEFYWQQFAAKVERRIELEENREPLSIGHRLLDAFLVHRKPFGVGFASALTLVMIAFGVWSVWYRTPVLQPLVTERGISESSNGGQSTVQTVSVDSRAQDYLEQSKVLLIGLMNTDTKAIPSSGPLLEREREVSRRLVRESTSLTSALNDPSQRRMRELVADLQMILVQIANLSTDRGTAGVEIIKGGIEHNGIIFKINVEEIQRATRSNGKTGGTVKPTT